MALTAFIPDLLPGIGMISKRNFGAAAAFSYYNGYLAFVLPGKPVTTDKAIWPLYCTVSL